MNEIDPSHFENLLASVALTMPRLFAVFTVTPFLSPNVITGLSRNSLMLMLALFMSPLAGDLPSMPVVMWLAIAGKEALIGVMLGLGFGIFFWAIQSVGDLIDFQTGSGNAAGYPTCHVTRSMRARDYQLSVEEPRSVIET